MEGDIIVKCDEIKYIGNIFQKHLQYLILQAFYSNVELNRGDNSNKFNNTYIPFFLQSFFFQLELKIFNFPKKTQW